MANREYYKEMYEDWVREAGGDDEYVHNPLQAYDDGYNSIRKKNECHYQEPHERDSREGNDECYDAWHDGRKDYIKEYWTVED